ncbi:MAG: hypothetical protein NZ772_14965 [Cyanobacteria bacterium]|nr:hypothetical protein [Cyanobacteriota bacterium]MDW8202669.1 hypothetical protein [Cyanobacteriota bacterium SKYGB_h_bin112]
MPSSSKSRQSALRRSRRAAWRRKTLADLEHTFESALEATTQQLHDLRRRYDRLKADQHHYDQLHQRLQATEQRSTVTPLTDLHHELRELRQQLIDLEIQLESQLFSWDGFSDLFWLAIRFGGLGILLGWLLHWLIQQ